MHPIQPKKTTSRRRGRNISVLFLAAVLALSAVAVPMALARGSKTVAGEANAPSLHATVLTNTKGLTLYTYEKDEAGKSNCTGDCIKDWIPVHPIANAKPIHNWTIVSREDGSKQWAHNGKPLYLSIKDKEGGDVMGLGNDPNFHPVGIQPFAGLAFTARLPAGWHIEKFQTNNAPVTDLKPPAGFAIKEVMDANAVVLVDSQNKTVYTYGGDVNNDILTCGAIASATSSSSAGNVCGSA